MFIRKWRYMQNLENARSEGIREGKREANEQKLAYIEYLEEENKALKEKLEATAAAADIATRDRSTACCENAGPECPNQEDREAENQLNGDDCDCCPGWCTENKETLDCTLNPESVMYAPDEESFF